MLYNPGKKFSISVYGTYVSSSTLQNDVNSTDPIERNMMLDLKGGYGYGAELDYKPNLWNLDLTFFLSSEYLKVKDSDLYLLLNQDSAEVKIRMTEEFYMIPLEFGAKWDIPVSSNTFKIYIGGGGGFYFGDRTRTIGTALSSYTTKTKAGFSVNVLAGMEYYLAKNFAADFQFKFRDGSFDVESRFKQNYINVNGYDFYIGDTVSSRIIVDGARVSLGLRYNF